MGGAKTVFFPRNMAEALSCLNSSSEPQVMAGCTLERGLPSSSIMVNATQIEELGVIDPHERFIDFGSAATFSQILGTAKRRLPSVFFESIESIATPFVRNRATIGGNICAPGRRRTLFSALLALDARLEFKGENETLFIHLGTFNKVPQGMMLTKIRVPVDEWNISIFKRPGPARIFTEESASFVFLAMTGKGGLSDLRIAYSQHTAYRSRALENRLIGMRLPLTQKTVSAILDETAERLKNSLDSSESPHSTLDSPVAARQFLDLLEFSLTQLM
ncbi:MAG: FAD binding domain-containing protein [Treponema sp.]|jgi:CO/xanthine dehydrogenase FAD-binding subunit|nr:FAD binding domain-containing protein [Treponema sp.]